jgi:uncharacterized membrane protein
VTLLLAFLIGCFAGLRALTAPAVTAWGAYLGWLKLVNPLAFIGSLPEAIVLTLLALGELVHDKRPTTPNRTAPMGLIARIVTGGLSGACVAANGSQSALLGAVLGAAGGVAGCFGGYQARRRLVKGLPTPDFVIAVVEDLLAVGGCLWIVSRSA